MKQERDCEMREEYDFSGSTPARFAARMTAMERDELLKRSAVRDVQTWMVHALLQVQRLEAALFAYLVLARNDSPEQAGATAAALFDGRESHGLSRLIADPLIRERMDKEVGERFKQLLSERNWLVHRGGYESLAALSAGDRTQSLIHRLEHIAIGASDLMAVLQQLIEQQLARTGLSKQQIDEKTTEIAALWLAA